MADFPLACLTAGGHETPKMAELLEQVLFVTILVGCYLSIFFFGWGLLYDPYALKNKVLAGFEYALVIGMTIFNNKHIFQAATSSQVGCCSCHNQISQDSLER